MSIYVRTYSYVYDNFLEAYISKVAKCKVAANKWGNQLKCQCYGIGKKAQKPEKFRKNFN